MSDAQKQYVPSPIGEAEVRKAGNRFTLVFVRDLKHSPSKVWTALTDPGHLKAWAPLDVDRDLASKGTAQMTMFGITPPQSFATEIRLAEAPRLLEYTFGKDVVRWELEATDAGTRLTLRHTLDDATWAPKSAAGWHMALDVAERALDGHPMGRIAGRDARDFGWEKLNAEYCERFGIENTGWPEEVVGS